MCAGGLRIGGAQAATLQPWIPPYSCGMAMGSGVSASVGWGVHSSSFRPWDLGPAHHAAVGPRLDPVQYSGEQSASEVSTSGPADGVFARAERATLSGASWSVSGVVSGVEGGGR